MKNHILLSACLLTALISCDDQPLTVGAMNPDAATSSVGDGASETDTRTAGQGPSVNVADALPLNSAADANAASIVVADTMPDSRCPTKFRTVTLQPGPEGKDTIVNSLEPNRVGPDYGFFRATAWTWNGVPGTHRSLLQFELPVTNQEDVVSATLTLFGEPTTTVPPVYTGHAALDGVSNKGVLLRIMSPWNEDVSWAAQPSTAQVPLQDSWTSEAITLPPSQSESQTYTIDVTPMVAPMAAGALPNYGFLVRLVTEEPYRQLGFCSSDHVEAALHPKLTIVYQCK